MKLEVEWAESKREGHRTLRISHIDDEETLIDIFEQDISQLTGAGEYRTIRHEKRAIANLLFMAWGDDDSNALSITADRQAISQLEEKVGNLKEMNAAMESLLAEIGEHFGVTNGGPGLLLDAIKAQSAENSRYQIAIEEAWQHLHRGHKNNAIMALDEVHSETTKYPDPNLSESISEAETDRLLDKDAHDK